MAPTLHLVRHAQGYHNLSVANQNMPDPLLTPYGKHQCEQLQSTFPYTSLIDAVFASPLKRTLQTGLLSFSSIISQKTLTVLAVPEIQETSDFPCDTGSDKAELEEEFKNQPVDLSRVHKGWNSKTGRWAPTAAAIEERCRVARRLLRERKEEHIVVVTHGGLLHYFTEDWTDMDKFHGESVDCDDYIRESAAADFERAGTGWANTEVRSYIFDPVSGDNASLVETEESRRRRRGLEKPLGEAEQRNLKRTATLDSEKSEYVKQLEQDSVRVHAKV